MRDDLPLLPLADLPGGAGMVVLCPTSRLANGLRRAHGEAQMARGLTVWAALGSATPAQWLDHFVSSALLRGEIPVEAVPGRFLTRPQERCLWEQAVAADDVIAGGELFDRAGMALAAMEAEALRRTWRIEVPEALHTDEYRAFLRWRGQVSDACLAGHWRTATEAMAWRIDCVARGIGGLPLQVGIAGFTAPDPVLSRLLAVLEARGVTLFRVIVGASEGNLLDGNGGSATSNPAAAATQRACIDAADECRAAARWVLARLANNEQARLRIAVADLPARWRLLESALEEALHPHAVGAGWAGLERDFALAGGLPLAEQPTVAVALSLLGLLAHPRRIAQADFGALLCAPGWSADVTEADGRARLEATLRERLPPEMSLERLRRAVQRLATELALPQLLRHIDALAEAQRTLGGRQLPGAWGRSFADLLELLGWPGQRSPLAAEQVAREQFLELLTGLTTLDAVVGRVDVGSALRLAQQMARDLSFAAPRRRAPRVEVCALSEVLAEPVQGLWLMGMNEGEWPLVSRPNPLLPAELQRRLGIPAARVDLLGEQAQALQALWCAQAGEVVFSWAASADGRTLRPSVLLAGMAAAAVDEGEEIDEIEAIGEGERPAAARGQVLERIEDSRAPPVTANERIRGGTALLQAQAVCPAWGFHQYRLGAAVLPAPTFGLDARSRGGLLHGALEAFWDGRDLAWLLSLSEEARAERIAEAVNAALAEFDREAVEPLSPRLSALEGERLQALLATWLAFEATRVSFRVAACEERHELDIEGLPVRVVVDRIDELEDGRLVVIDYKSGRSASADSWADARPSEPQLPIYAALAFPDKAVAAVALARVVADEPAFLGVAADDGLLPGIKSLANQRKRYAEDEFPDWPALRALWAERIAELAREVREGCAAVVFADEKDIEFCEVKPLLRVAERRMQWEEQ